MEASPETILCTCSLRPNKTDDKKIKKNKTPGEKESIYDE